MKAKDRIFIQTTAIFKSDSEIDYESLGIKVDDNEDTLFIFDSNEIEAFNESTSGMTTIWLKSGNTITINIGFFNFIDIIKSKNDIFKF